MNLISLNIKHLVEGSNLTKDAFGKLFGLNRGAIGTYIEGKALPKIETLQKISAHFNISIDDLVNLEIKNNKPETLLKQTGSTKKDNYIELPYVSLAARATFSVSCDIVHESQETYNTYRNSTFDYNNVKVLEVNGDNMEPTLVSGEKVLIREVDSSKWEYFTGLAAVAFKYMFVIKRITWNSGGILTLSSDNPLGGSFDVKLDDICSIYKIEHSVYRPLK